MLFKGPDHLQVYTYMYALKLSESISCTDNKIANVSLNHINTIHICAFMCELLYIWKWSMTIFSGISPTGPIFVPGMAGQRLQSKTVQRHVWTEARQTAGMLLLSQLL